MLEIVIIGEYTVDFSRHEISKNGEAVIVSKKISSARAWNFFEMLIRARGRILTYEFLDDSGLWPEDDGFFADHKSSYKAWVSEFNKTLGAYKLIKNISGVGYQLDPTVKVVISRNLSSEDEEYSDVPLDQENISEGISQLNEQLDTLGINLDTILHQLDFLKSSKDQNWMQNHGSDFDSMLLHFMYMKKIVEEKQHDLQRVKSSLRHRRSDRRYSASSVGYSSGFSSSSPDSSSKILVQNEIDKTSSFLSNLYGEITFICESLVELLAQ